jgi:hypothetical protein
MGENSHMFLVYVIMVKCQQMSRAVRHSNFYEGRNFRRLALIGLNFYIITRDPVTSTTHCNITRVWKWVRRAVTSQIHSRLGCGGGSAIVPYLESN